MMNNKKLGIIGLISATVVAGVLIYNDLRSVKKPAENLPVITSASTTPTTVSGVTMTGNGNVKIEAVPISSGTKLPPQPTLIRPDFKNTLSSKAKIMVMKEIERLTTAIKAEPKNVGNWIYLGGQRKALGDLEGARDAWEYAKALNPGNIVPWNNLGDLYHFYLKNFVKSEENWKKTIALKSDYMQGYIGLSELYKYSLKEKLAEIEAILKKGIVQNPDFVDLQIMLARYYAQDVKQIADAKAAYERAIATAEKAGNKELVEKLKAELSEVK
ncbi:MAG: hypothetical protein AAB552_01835 [Patescibacteria group bacterium]